MKLQELAIQQLVPIINGGEYSATPSSSYRGLKALVTLFQRYGRGEVYDYVRQEPKNPIDGRPYSRTAYTTMALREMNNTDQLYNFLSDQLNNELYTSDIKNVLTSHGYNVECIAKKWTITNVDVNHTTTTVDMSFAENRDKILACLNNAQVSIDIAMAWFTSDAFLPILLQKQLENVRIRIIVNNDAVNALHGCDLSSFNVKKIRGNHGGIMHDKLCIIDNQILLTGSYNWSENAENKNVENVAKIQDNTAASAATREFNRLWGSV